MNLVILIFNSRLDSDIREDLMKSKVSEKREDMKSRGRLYVSREIGVPCLGKTSGPTYFKRRAIFLS